MNVLTDVRLIVSPLVIVARLKSARPKKIILALFFMARVWESIARPVYCSMLTWDSVVTAVICQVIYLNRIKPSGDLTFEIWPVTLCSQIVQCLSILATCLVYLRPFLDSLETGFIQVGDLRRRHVSGFGYRAEAGSRGPRDKKSGVSFSSLKSKLSRAQPRNEDIELQDNARTNLQDLGNTAFVDAEHHDWDAHSRSHILRTTTLTVEERYRDNHSLTTSPSAQFVHYPKGSR